MTEERVPQSLIGGDTTLGVQCQAFVKQIRKQIELFWIDIVNLSGSIKDSSSQIPCWFIESNYANHLL